MKKNLVFIFVFTIIFSVCNGKSLKTKNLKTKITKEIQKIQGDQNNLLSIGPEKLKELSLLKKKQYSLEILSPDENLKELGVPVRITLIGKDGKTNVIDGVNIKLPKTIPIAALSYDEKSYLEMVKKEAPNFVGKKGNKEFVAFPLEELALTYEKLNSKYPNVKNLSEANLEKVMDDFPNLSEKLLKITSVEELLGIYQFMSDIYNKQLVYEVHRDLIARKDSLRETSIYGLVEGEFHMTEAERIVIFDFEGLNMKPHKALALKQSSEIAKIESEKWAKELGIGTGDTKADALRHTLWMYQLCVEITKQTGLTDFLPYDKNEGFKFAEEFGTARESKIWERYLVLKDNPEKQVNYEWLDMSNRMDLHNNVIGREYFRTVTKEGTYGLEWKSKGKYLKIPVLVFPTFETPSLQVVIKDLKEKIEKSVYIDINNEKTKKDTLEKGITKFGFPEHFGKIIYLRSK